MGNMSNIPFSDEYEKLKLLIYQGQFELLFSESESPGCIRSVYLMNDVVESFLVFHEAALTGEYLGEDFCSDEERRMSYLAEFPPLNFCCYPAVSDRYLVPSYPWWQVSEAALDEMKAFARKAGDRSLMCWLTLYARFPRKVIAKQIARLLYTVRHAEVVDLLEQRLSHAAGIYQDRVFEEAEEIRIQKIREKAELRKKELEQSGKRVEMLKEEPFLYAKDSVEYKIHLMIWKTVGKNRQVDVETFGL